MPSSSTAPLETNDTSEPPTLNAGLVPLPNWQFMQLPSVEISRIAGPARTIARPSGENIGRRGWPHTATVVHIRRASAPSERTSTIPRP